jgi:L,D-peptidoglycan transpeptidase YkuD (ErfK/YbiS/YcfS/YnhG family)
MYFLISIDNRENPFNNFNPPGDLSIHRKLSKKFGKTKKRMWETHIHYIQSVYSIWFDSTLKNTGSSIFSGFYMDGIT